MVFQDYALFPNMTVEENIRFGIETRLVTERIQELLELLDLEGSGQPTSQRTSVEVSNNAWPWPGAGPQAEVSSPR